MSARFGLRVGASPVKSWWLQYNSKNCYAVGRNYVAHAKELNNPVPSSLFWFLKPVSAIIGPGEKHRLPPERMKTHHEVEVGVMIGKSGIDVSPDLAETYISGIFLSLDMTDREGQNAAKEKSLPWTAAKGWDTSLPVSNLLKIEDIDANGNSILDLLGNIEMWLKVNDMEKMRASTNQMIFDIKTQIATISKVHRLDPGDIILTGTPHGVGPCVPGDVMTAGIEGCDGLLDMQVEVVAR